MDDHMHDDGTTHTAPAADMNDEEAGTKEDAGMMTSEPAAEEE